MSLVQEIRPAGSLARWLGAMACTRRFWTSDVSIRKDSQSARTIHNDAPETARALYSSSDFRDQEPFEAGPHLDVMSCRRIVVVCDRHYECDYCGKGFRRPTSLKVYPIHIQSRLSPLMHELAHTDPYEEPFRRAPYASFIVHTNSNAPDLYHFPAYRCTFRGCERTFSALSKMRRHAQFHDFTNAADVSEIADDDDVDLARSR
ncbi:hypothetical protein PENSPDRAFT_25823 [Peniophora sp. CONT]|nr:hypothetical protein PENSPDRAFT_25823 [Peniophora sp. CONT]